MVPESKLTFSYERQAMNGEEIPNGLTYPDQITYLRFRMLYAQLRMGIIDRDTAICEKRKIMHEREAYRLCEENGHSFVKIIKSTELARAAYRKERTLENADRLLRAVEGVLT